MPKSLRYLFRDSQEQLEWYDIKGQEIFISMMESGSAKGSQCITDSQDIMTMIAEQAGLDRKTVKDIMHPSMKGMGERNLCKKHGEEATNTTTQAFNQLFPEVKERKLQTEEIARETGRLPMTRLGRRAIQIDVEKETTRPIALMDQGNGAEMTKSWAIEYNRRHAASQGPVLLDMHDALVIATPRGRARQEPARVETLEKSLGITSARLGYLLKPGLDAPDRYEEAAQVVDRPVPVETRAAWTEAGRAQEAGQVIKWYIFTLLMINYIRNSQNVRPNIRPP